MVDLRLGGLRLLLAPEVGGSVAGLWWNERPVLRSVERITSPSSPRALGSFPLVPYSNRIGQRSFQWAGRTIHLAPNFEGSPHSLHGVGWLRPWTVHEKSSTTAHLFYRHVADTDWPWAFEAEQRIHLENQSAIFELSVRNVDRSSWPAGLGWHPYFVRRASSRVQLAAKILWSKTPDQLTHDAQPTLGVVGAVADFDLDHCLSDWSHEAIIEDETIRCRVTADVDHVVVFTPVGRDVFCVEPVSHVTNAHQAQDPVASGLVVLEPGQTLTRTMTIEMLDHV